MAARRPELGSSIALASAAAVASGAYMLFTGHAFEAYALMGAGVAGLVMAVPFLFSKAKASAHGCGWCGFEAAPTHPRLSFCMMCGRFPKPIRRIAD